MSTTPPTTAQEALDLAWELAHPVKEGQHIPEGTRLLDRSGGNDFSAYTTLADITINAREALTVRTQDPLPDPEPDWLDALAVMAFVKGRDSCADPQVFARENKTGTQWLRDTKVYRWTELVGVVPLCPKEDQ